MRLGLIALVGGLMIAPDAYAQVARRPAVRAFPFAVTPYVGLGFRGARADEADPATCPAQPNRCFQHKASSGPEVGVGLQVPLAGAFGVQATGSVARPTQLVCIRNACSEREKITAVRGTGLLLFRFKARAPIYFGLGGTLVRFDPGPVFSQTTAVTEFGFAFAIGFDFSMANRFGGRVSFVNYFMSPGDSNLPSDFTATNSAYDAVLTIGARLGLGS